MRSDENHFKGDQPPDKEDSQSLNSNTNYKFPPHDDFQMAEYGHRDHKDSIYEDPNYSHENPMYNDSYGHDNIALSDELTPQKGLQMAEDSC